ncbi:MAG TPA: hypothetical protein DCQ98_03075 [Planctomycetaceae bacterium]|nr:hypothetical protein [Planctomycetaceae bacterium]HRF02071.1 hypothetical protein [Pirellulaceae bacterium]
MASIRPRSATFSGCGYVLAVLIAACVLLLVNGVLVQAALVAYRPVAPAELNDQRAQQAIRFLLPVAMLFMEYWLYDWMIDRLTSEGSDRGDGRREAPSTDRSNSPS